VLWPGDLPFFFLFSISTLLEFFCLAASSETWIRSVNGMIDDVDPFLGEGKKRHIAPAPAVLDPHAVDAFSEPRPAEESWEPPHRQHPQSLIARTLVQLIPRGGSLASIFNLASATLGASIISLPAAFKMCGIALSTVLLLLTTLGTVYSMRLLARISVRTGLRSYEELARMLLGKSMDYVVSASMFVFCFGTMVAYVISMRDLISPFFAGDDNVSSFLREESGTRLLVCVVWLLGMLPLSFPKEINSLRHVSAFGVCAVVFLVISMVTHALANGMKTRDLSTLEYARTSNEAIVGASVFMFAFLCQTNAFEVYGEMENASPQKLSTVTAQSMAGCCGLYIIAGFFGYADFGSGVEDAVLKNYRPRSEPMIAISLAGLAVKLCVAFALCVQPARDTIFYMLNMGHYQVVETKKRVIVCGTMSVAALLLGLFIPKITVVFGLLGSFSGSIIGFIFPALFVIYSGDWGIATVGLVDYLATWLLLLSGVAVLIFGTSASIYEMF
jgi:amino acid permease